MCFPPSKIWLWIWLALVSTSAGLNCAYTEQYEITQALTRVSESLDEWTSLYNQARYGNLEIDFMAARFTDFSEAVAELNLTISEASLRGQHRAIIAGHRLYRQQQQQFIRDANNLLRVLQQNQTQKEIREAYLQQIGEITLNFFEAHNAFVDIVNQYEKVKLNVRIKWGVIDIAIM